MALRRPPTTFSDEISAADLAANSVGASELADNAVDSDAIAANAVVTAKIADSTGASDGITTAKLATNAVTTAKITDANITTGKLADNAITTAKVATATFTDNIEVKPHIIPGMLYPAMKDSGGVERLSDGVTALAASTVGPAGSTITSSKYGTVQADGKMYYFTSIQGSKPIHDPRIGAHYGCQRFDTKTLQEIPEQSAANSTHINRVDGRENVRTNSGRGTKAYYNAHGSYIHLSDTASYMEITGYFSDMNILTWCDANHQYRWTLDAAAEHGTSFGNTISAAPHASRWTSPASLVNLEGLSSAATLGIHTIKIRRHSTDSSIYGFEFIVQDTTTASGTQAAQTLPKVQIHPQNVVSYGKKFSIDDSGLHFNPFAIKTDGSTDWAIAAHNGTSWPVGTGASHNIDTATSLGLDKWLHSSNYYRPYNGGRVVLWVDSTGAIKTSVTVMPPNARSIANSASPTGAPATKTNASAANDQYLTTFETGSMTAFECNALTEEAHTYFSDELGNGGGEGGQNAGGALNDMQSLLTNDIAAWCMEDGNTIMTTWDVRHQNNFQEGFYRNSTSSKAYFTFLGTGITGFVPNATVATVRQQDKKPLVQNVPYGTHVIEWSVDGTGNNSLWKFDGVTLFTDTSSLRWMDEFTIFQPKRPPIPENAVVLADYMLFADHVKTTSADKVSKGVRRVHCTKDFQYNTSGTNWVATGMGTVSRQPFYGHFTQTGNAVSYANLPYFGTQCAMMVESVDPSFHDMTIDGTAVDASADKLNSAFNDQDNWYVTAAQPLGLRKFTGALKAGGYRFSGMDIVSPIHTSSHYQAVEGVADNTLPGGDRNMEQTNLIVTADGKTWEELSRDRSHCGPKTFASCTRDSGNLGVNEDVVFNMWRGDGGNNGAAYTGGGHLGIKNFAVRGDKYLKPTEDGLYQLNFYAQTQSSNVDGICYVQVNEATVLVVTQSTESNGRSVGLFPSMTVRLNRGDELNWHWGGADMYGGNGGYIHASLFKIGE